MTASVDAHLLFPPPWSLFHSVHLSLPLLRGHLEAKGFRVAVTDLNVEVANLLLQPEPVLLAAEVCAERLHASHLTGEEIDRLETALVLSGFVPDRLAAAATLCRGAGERLEAMTGAAQILRFGAEIVAASAGIRWDAVAGEYRARELAGALTLDHALAALERTDLDPIERTARQALERALLRHPARLYGLGCACSDQVPLALRLAGWIRELQPDARIVLGGAAIPFAVQALARRPDAFSTFDYVIRGDGELPLEMLLGGPETDAELDAIPNLWRRVGGEVRAGSRAFNAGFQSAARPVFRDLDLAAYYTPPTLPFVTARRCYWNRCRFCSITYDKRVPFSPLPAPALVEQLEACRQETGCGIFTFVDEAVPAPRVRRIAEALLAADSSVEAWDALCRFEPKLDRPTLDLARKAGMRAIYFGLESGSQRVVDRMEKGFGIEVARQNLQDAHAAGIWTHCFCMVGFPGEDESDLQRTIRFLLDEAGSLDSVGTGAFDIARGSPVGDDPAAYGLRPPTSSPLSLEHTWPEPTREALLARRLAALRGALSDETFTALHLGALNAGNLIRFLLAHPEPDALRQRQAVILDRRREQRGLLRNGARARVRFHRAVSLHAPDGPEPDAVVPVFDQRSGAFATLPLALVTPLARREGAWLLEVEQLGRTLCGASGVAAGLLGQGFLVDARGA